MSEHMKMKSYCVESVEKCRKNTEDINPRVSKTSNGRTMVLLKRAICDSNKSRFIESQEDFVLSCIK